MGRGDLVREHFLETGCRAGGHGRIQRRREDAGLRGRVRAVLGGIHADHGGLVERAEDVMPGEGKLGLVRGGRRHELTAGVSKEAFGRGEKALTLGARLRGLLCFTSRVHPIEGPAPVQLFGLAELVAGARRRDRDPAPTVSRGGHLQQPRGRIVGKHARLPHHRHGAVAGMRHDRARRLAGRLWTTSIIQNNQERLFDVSDIVAILEETEGKRAA
jgi:hypothetical protein